MDVTKVKHALVPKSFEALLTTDRLKALVVNHLRTSQSLEAFSNLENARKEMIL